MADAIDNPQAREAWSGRPQSLQELKEAVKILFHCMSGPPCAYFEIPLMSHDRYESGEFPVERFIYTRVGWEDVPEPKGQAIHQRLIDKMWHMFQTTRLLVEDKTLPPLLFWRRELEFEQGKHFPKETAGGDGIPYLRLSCRLVIPGVDLRPYEVEWVK